MKNKYLVIPNTFLPKSSNTYCLLFPLKGFCVGFLHEFAVQDIPSDSYIYVNRLLDTPSILALKNILEKYSFKGIVFEDLGILELIKSLALSLETIFYPTHAITSVQTLNTYLEYVDTAVISLDITKEETKEMITKANKPLSYYIFGPLPYMYSRRTLLTNYEKNFALKENKRKLLEDEVTHKTFKAIENAYGTVLFDENMYDGRIFLEEKSVKHFIINFDWEKEEINESYFEDFLKQKDMSKTTDGFLNKKTIYRLPPKKEGL